WKSPWLFGRRLDRSHYRPAFLWLLPDQDRASDAPAPLAFLIAPLALVEFDRRLAFAPLVLLALVEFDRRLAFAPLVLLALVESDRRLAFVPARLNPDGRRQGQDG